MPAKQESKPLTSTTLPETEPFYRSGCCKATTDILVILFVCGVLALGISAVITYFDDDNTDSFTPSYICNPRQPHKLAYIWPQNVKKIINDVVDNNLHVTNDDRAVLLKTELMRFDTYDVFYIIVYDGTSGPANHAFAGVKNEFIAVFKPGKCNVVVYRSHFWRSSPSSALSTITKEVEDVCRAGVTESSDYSTFLKNSFKLIDDIRFLGIFGKEHNVSVRSANSNNGRAWGPGWWKTMPVFRNGTKEATGKQFILVAGFK